MISSTIKLIQAIWSSTPDSFFTTEEVVADREREFHKIRDSLYVQMTSIVQNLQLQPTQEKPKEVKPEEQKVELVALKEEFKQHKADETKLWKESVEKARQEKAAEKQAQKHEAASAPPSPKRELVKVIDPDVERLLMSLKPKKIQLLRDILDHKPALKYDTVYRLITKQLGGQISSTSTSGSHRRVRIGKIYTEILATDMIDPTSQDSDSDDIAEAPTPSAPTPSASGLFGTGGVSRPHRRSHNSGHNSKKLSRFNAELLSKGLTAAGITTQLLDAIDEKKASARATI